MNWSILITIAASSTLSQNLDILHSKEDQSPQKIHLLKIWQHEKNIAKRCSRRPLFKTLILFVSHQTSLKVMRTDSHTDILICRDAPYYVRGVWKCKNMQKEQKNKNLYLFELQTPDFAWMFIWTVPTNYIK